MEDVDALVPDEDLDCRRVDRCDAVVVFVVVVTPVLGGAR